MMCRKVIEGRIKSEHSRKPKVYFYTFKFVGVILKRLRQYMIYL
jgi:hypothetical protein